jgi:8-oxo-dGTP diphosphatase
MSLAMKRGALAIKRELIRAEPAVNRGIGGLIDLCCRSGYRQAYRLQRLWWFLRRPRLRGAQIALWHDGEILLIRSSYRSCWELPGGGVRPGESPRDAALRECREEVGIALAATALREAQDGEILWERRHDHVTIFETIAALRPLPRPDGREIVAAVFRNPAALAASELNPHLARYLAGRR